MKLTLTKKQKDAAKIFIMTVIGFLSTIIADNESATFAFVTLSTVLFSIQYAVKNYLMPSKTESTKWDWRDTLSGVIIAICMADSAALSQIIIGNTIAWSLLWKTSIGAVIGYFSKTFLMDNKNMTNDS